MIALFYLSRWGWWFITAACPKGRGTGTGGKLLCIHCSMILETLSNMQNMGEIIVFFKGLACSNKHLLLAETGKTDMVSLSVLYMFYSYFCTLYSTSNHLPLGPIPVEYCNSYFQSRGILHTRLHSLFSALTAATSLCLISSYFLLYHF